jgi:hypothetical protein
LNHTYYGATQDCDDPPIIVGFRWYQYGKVDGEGPIAGALLPPARRQTDVVFEFGHEDAWLKLATILVERQIGSEPYTLAGEDTPWNLGLGVGQAIVGPTRGQSLREGVGWHGESSPRGEASLLRNDLQPDRPVYTTYYARIGGTTLGLVSIPGGSGIYGSEWCGGASTGIKRGFDCDPSHWWNPAFGVAPEPNTGFSDEPLGERPGAPYQLRDIDCFDGALARGVPVYASLAFLGEAGPCAEP